MSNRLATSTSPYLLQHQDNPVDWREWSPEAFAEAERRDVPVLLSVGYAACHWCHVMAHESFEDEAIATVMNDNFVNVKVDREERPDVDAVYMEATQAMTGHGGWPMTVFCTPERRALLLRHLLPAAAAARHAVVRTGARRRRRGLARPPRAGPRGWSGRDPAPLVSAVDPPSGVAPPTADQLDTAVQVLGRSSTTNTAASVALRSSHPSMVLEFLLRHARSNR